MNGYFHYLLMLMLMLMLLPVYFQSIFSLLSVYCQLILMMILMRISRAPHFRLSSASLPKSEIAVVLELSVKTKKKTLLQKIMKKQVFYAIDSSKMESCQSIRNLCFTFHVSRFMLCVSCFAFHASRLHL